MTVVPFRLAVALFVMLSASVQAKLSVFPPSPTTDTPVILRGVDHCGRRPAPEITRNGAEITVKLNGTLITCPGPFPPEIPFEVRLGRLPAGRYHLTLAVCGPLRRAARGGVRLGFCVGDEQRHAQVTIVAPDGRGGNPCLTCD